MSNALNLTLIEGNLANDPELFYTKNGKSICKFDVALNSNFKQKEKEYQEVSFISVNVWGNVAEACATYLKKGAFVRIRGKLKQQSWIGKDGNKKRKVIIMAETVDFLGSRVKSKVA